MSAQRNIHHFETKRHSVLSTKRYLRRQVLFIIYGSLFLSFSLFIGMLGYHITADLNWVDSLYNSSMILTGMGPIANLTTDSAKYFASFYALYSGIAFLSTIGVIFAPLVHRLLHLLNVGEGTETN